MQFVYYIMFSKKMVELQIKKKGPQGPQKLSSLNSLKFQKESEREKEERQKDSERERERGVRAKKGERKRMRERERENKE